MKRWLIAPMVLAGVLGFCAKAPAACHRFGTQLECELGPSQLVFGTQAGEPVYGRAFRPSHFRGLPDERAMPEWPLRMELQNVGRDPALCRKLGNETYCY